MIQTWWIRRWYFLYINVCIILHIVALSKSFQFRHITFYINNIFFTRHYFHKQLILFNSFYLVIRLTLHLSIHIVWCYRFSNGLQSKTNYKVHDWLLLNISLSSSHESHFHKNYVSHRHFYADVPTFTCVFRSYSIGWWSWH